MVRERVLVVDDDPIIALEAQEYLQSEGFDVVCASSGRDAIEAAGEPRSFAALVTDIDLGEGMDGFGVARRLRILDPDLPVIFISGADAGRYAIEAMKSSSFIAKPFAPHQIARALAERRQRPQ
jgi:DNA-binding NtrC family response regulator